MILRMSIRAVFAAAAPVSGNGEPDLVRCAELDDALAERDCVRSLPDKIDLVARREKVILDLCAAPDFTIEALRQTMARSNEIH